MCCRRSFGVSTWSTGISLDVPALAPRRRHPGHLSRVTLLELANPRFELEPLRAARVKAHVVEEEARVPRSAPGLSQEARGNDAVRVDVGQIERGRDRGESR